MTAASWTAHAKDITDDEPTWRKYLSAAALADLIGLAEKTILDTITRGVDDPTDPRTAIYRPAARIGATALNAMPRWTQAQANEYRRLRENRDLGGRAEKRRQLPTYAAQDAAKAGLATTRGLAEHFGCAENTIRWWARSASQTFPPEVGVAAREGEFTYGPPRALRRIAEVGQWIQENPERVKRLNRSRAAATKAKAKGRTKPVAKGSRGTAAA